MNYTINKDADGAHWLHINGMRYFVGQGIVSNYLLKNALLSNEVSL